jgi:hypothetical protein
MNARSWSGGKSGYLFDIPMISPEIQSKLASYWKSKNVVCLKASIGGALFGTELAELWELVGMPSQDWWLFRFVVPSNQVDGPSVIFGTVGANWSLHYKPAENCCIAVDDDGVESFGNSSFVAFMQMLVLFDKGCKRIQRECGGDSGEDWARGDVIIQEMEASMRVVDPQAFEKDSNLWPYLLVDING